MKTKNVPLADVLWDAANLYLRPSMHEEASNYSCCAVSVSLAGGVAERYENGYPHPAHDFIRSLGCDPYDAEATMQFNRTGDAQGARYMWLLLAMHFAEDEGIEIEVES